MQTMYRPYSHKRNVQKVKVHTDKRRTLYAIIDTETANSYLDENGKLCLTDSLVYDIAIAIIDRNGRVYDVRRYIVDEIFHTRMMVSCYYAQKMPEYIQQINNGDFEVLPIMDIYKAIRNFLKAYNVKAIMAHNARFDCRALNNTIRYVTGSRVRWFLPFGLEVWDTQKMAHDTICKQKTYIKYCERNDYMTKHKVPRVRETAEILYRYISGNDDFVEVHKGYEDIMIEKEIFAHCMRQHKKMTKKAF